MRLTVVAPSGAGPWQRRAGPRRLRAWVRVIARWQPLSSRKTRSRAATPANRSGHPARKLSAPARFGARRPCVAHRPLLTPKRAAICGRVLVSSSQACRVRSRKSSEYAFARPPACQQCRANSTEDGSSTTPLVGWRGGAGGSKGSPALATGARSCWRPPRMAGRVIRCGGVASFFSATFAWRGVVRAPRSRRRASPRRRGGGSRARSGPRSGPDPVPL